MVDEFKINKQKWFSVNQVSQEEIENLCLRLSIDPYIAQEILSPTPKSRIEFYKDSIFLVLHFPAIKHSHKNPKQEIDFIIRKDDLVTIQYENIDSLYKLSKSLEVKTALNKEKEILAENIFSVLIKEIYNSVYEELSFIEDRIDQATEKSFKEKSSNQKKLVFEIGKIIKDILFIEKTLENQDNILKFLRDGSAHIISKDFSLDVDSIIIEYEKIRKSVKHCLLIAQELRKTNDSLLEANQSQAIKQLTVVGSVLLPLNLIAVIFAMRTEGMPLVNNPNGFWIIIGLMVICALSSLLLAKNRKWLD